MQRGHRHRMAIALVLGLFVNVLIAWTFDRIHPLAGVGLNRNGLSWPFKVPTNWPKVPTVTRLRRAFGATRMDCFSWPTVADPQKRLAHSNQTYHTQEARFGWPLPALAERSGYSVTSTGNAPLDLGTLRSGLPWPKSWPTAKIVVDDRLPIFPLWPGFLLNTLFFGVLAWAMMAGVSYLRHRRRAKPGMCVACGYPVSGLHVCPECGTAVASSAKSLATAAEPVGPTTV